MYNRPYKLSDEEEVYAEKRDSENDGWSLSDEREFSENLVQQRFDFLLVVYSLIVAGALSTTSQSKLIAALFAGCVLCLLVSITILRIHLKLDWILRKLHARKRHPVNRVGSAFSGPLWDWSAIGLIGWAIPALCTVSLFVAGVLAARGVITATDQSGTTTTATTTGS